jgi:hypothetical protein
MVPRWLTQNWLYLLEKRISARRAPVPVVLYEFRDSNPKSTSVKTWHAIGDERAIMKFTSDDELRGLAPTVRWTAADREVTYFGVYHKRMVGRFRRLLRERGAQLEIRHERPMLSGSPQFYLRAGPGK